MNLNKLARKITEKEGKKKSLSIAQVKEVMRILLTELAFMEFSEVHKILNRYRFKGE